VLVRPEEDVAVKVVMDEPPVALAVNGTETTPDVPPDAVPMVGACGTVVAVIEEDAAEVNVPLALAAETVKVYEVADCKPVTVIGEVPVPVNDPGVLVAVNVVTGPPVAAAV
jgi:hypothetical protein